MDVVEVMEDLAELIRAGTARPVTTDPRSVVNTPCVLIEPPTLDPSTSTGCGFVYRFVVLVIGTPGARAELGVLTALLGEVVDALPGFTLAEPVGYVPLMTPAQAEPSMAYRVTTEVIR